MVNEDYPEIIFIGEIYDVAQYRSFLDYGHFDYLYDKVNLYDKLVGIERYNYSSAQLTSAWQTVEGISDRMLNFLENHDEVRYGSVEFAGNPSRVVPDLIISSMMTSGPFMLYYGQELGECAVENEGFAGYNNRTTIFDYWSYDSMRRWYNNGKCSVAKLNAHEKWLRELYSKVLNLCNKNEALREGKFFDLMYVNLDNPKFDPHSCFCFMRYTVKEKLLIVVNFSDEEKNLEINIPEHAFEMADLLEGTIKENDLLWNKNYILKISRSKPLSVSVKGRDALIISISSPKAEDIFPKEVSKNPQSEEKSAEK